MNLCDWSDVPVSAEAGRTPVVLLASPSPPAPEPSGVDPPPGVSFSRVLAVAAVLLFWITPWTLLAVNQDSPELGALVVISSLLAAGAATCRGLGQALSIGLAAFFLMGVFLPELMRPRSRGGSLTACKSHLKNVGTALEMYSTDNGGLYPPSLAALTPNYLKTVPTCPSAGSDTYSPTFRRARGPDVYTFVCAGQNHTGAGVTGDYPQYSSVQGLIERP